MLFATPEAVDRYTLYLRSTHISDVELQPVSMVLENLSEIIAKVLIIPSIRCRPLPTRIFKTSSNSAEDSKNWTVKSAPETGFETRPKNRTPINSSSPRGLLESRAAKIPKHFR